MNAQELVEALLDPHAYPADAGVVGEITWLQTHISLLFFAGARVYKVKKAVDLGFLDFTVLERRRWFCEEEVRLNARLAPGVYRRVVPVVRTAAGEVRVDVEGETVDWAVEMVRLPEDRMLANLLERGAIDNELLNSLCTLLVAFHAESATGAGVDEHGAPAAVRANTEENFEQLLPFTGDPSDGESTLSETLRVFLRARSRVFLEEHRALFEERVAGGRVREGHGDLHAGNICIPENEIVIYDRIEFAARYRSSDVACDLAFLAMDLDHRGFPAFSRYLVHRYGGEANDPGIGQLADFYKAYRAVVRGKVASLGSRDANVGAENRERLRRDALSYLQLAASYELPATLVLLCGLPATGKTWLARDLARPLRATVLHSDVRRKVLAGVAPTQRMSEEYEAGLYTPEMKRRTYRSLLENAVKILRLGCSVVVDATFARREERSRFIDAAARLELPFFVVHVEAEERVIRERLALRHKEGGGSSDADLGVYLRARESFEPPTELTAPHVLNVLSGAGLAEERSGRLVDALIGLFGRD